MLGQLREQIPRLNEALDLASEFAGMLRKTNDQPFDDWLTKVEASNVRELKSFAAGLREDKAAVSNALTEKWSSGPVEGQVNRLKQIKRTMYGRAGLDLLRARVLHKD
jgi:transposase